jgi:hypothetical protein
MKVQQASQILSAMTWFCGAGSVGIGIACYLSVTSIPFLLPMLVSFLILIAAMYYLQPERNVVTRCTAIWNQLLVQKDSNDRKNGIIEFATDIQHEIHAIESELPEANCLRRYRLNRHLSSLEVLQRAANEYTLALPDCSWETASFSSAEETSSPTSPNSRSITPLPLEGNSQEVLSDVNLPAEHSFGLSSEGGSLSVPSGEVCEDELFGPSFMSQIPRLQSSHMVIFPS